MGSFCKKTFFRPLLSPRKLNKASFPNALRPDCPSRKFPGQQNYSENSESTEETESTEGTETTVSEPGRAGILACFLRAQAGKTCAPFPPTCPLACRPKGLHLPVDRGAQVATSIPACPLSIQVVTGLQACPLYRGGATKTSASSSWVVATRSFVNLSWCSACILVGVAVALRPFRVAPVSSGSLGPRSRNWSSGVMSLGSNNMLAFLGLFCAAPAGYFVIGSVLKYELGLLGAVQIREFHPVMLVAGLALSLTLNLWPFFKPDRLVNFPEEGTVAWLKGRGLNVALAVISGACLLVLLLYIVTENLLERGSVV